jgi:hypothetical protein
LWDSSDVIVDGARDIPQFGPLIEGRVIPLWRQKSAAADRDREPIVNLCLMNRIELTCNDVEIVLNGENARDSVCTQAGRVFIRLTIDDAF